MGLELDYSSSSTIAIALFVVSATAFLWVSPKKKGRVSALTIYPVKSCAGTELSVAFATDRGFQNDRIAQVIDQSSKYCTPRDKDKAKLFHVTTELQDDTMTLSAPGVPPTSIDMKVSKGFTTMATAVTGPEVKLQDCGNEVAKWLERATGMAGCRLARIGKDYNRQVVINPDQGEKVPTPNTPVSLADEAPYLLCSVSSLRDLNQRLKARGKASVDMRRFRPNIVVEHLPPWKEDTFKKIRIGSVEFLAWQRCGRCTMTTIDRDSLERGPEPLATLSTFRERAHGQRNFGMHMIPVSPVSSDNQIRVGDEVEILEYDDERQAEWARLFG